MQLSQKILEGRYHAPSHMSHAMCDMLAIMLTLDPIRRATLPQLWTHPWVIGSRASRSFKFALPQPLLPRPGADGCAPPDSAFHCTQSGADGGVLAHVKALGVPHGAIVGGLLANDCNQVTATYFLFAESMCAGERPPRVNASARELDRRLPRHAAAMSCQWARGTCSALMRTSRAIGTMQRTLRRRGTGRWCRRLPRLCTRVSMQWERADASADASWQRVCLLATDTL